MARDDVLDQYIRDRAYFGSFAHLAIRLTLQYEASAS
jgi:hypothetical protein